MLKRKIIKLALAFAMVLTALMGAVVYAQIGTEIASDLYNINSADFKDDNTLTVDYSYVGTNASPSSKMLAATYSKGELVMTNSKIFDVADSEIKDFEYSKPADDSIVKIYIWNGTDAITPMSNAFTVAVGSFPTNEPDPSIAPTNNPEKTFVVDGTKESDPTNKQFKSIAEAVAAAGAMNPQSEEEMITINVMPGDYEEQVRFTPEMKYITLQQMPGTCGKVDLHWYFCTSYCTSNADLDGYYDSSIDWSLNETWNGYNAGDEMFERYEIGSVIPAGTTVSYYDLNKEKQSKTITSNVILGSPSGKDKMAPLVVMAGAEYITVKDFNIVNSLPVFVTQAEKNAHITPEISLDSDHANDSVHPRRNNLAVCDENTPEEATKRITDILTSGKSNKEVIMALEALTDLTPGESAYLVRSNVYNERGHAISINGDKCTFIGITARGNQDSCHINNGRFYFKNCNLIGGIDFIYGNATAVFDECLIGAAGFSDIAKAATITAANTDIENPYGYLFYNCEIYNVRANTTDASYYGRPWRQNAQITWVGTTIDDNATTGKSKASIDPVAWRNMSDNKIELARYFEYGTKNKSGVPLDMSERLINTTAGMGSVLDDWQVLEFNPRNYFTNSFRSDSWDPMNLAPVYAGVDKVAVETVLDIPEGSSSEVDLPIAPEGYAFKWVSNSEYAKVNEEGTKVSVIRPANGEASISTDITLYVKDLSKTDIGTKRIIPVIINPTTDTEDVFDVNGTVSMVGAASATDVEYTVKFLKGDAVIKSVKLTIPAGATSRTYKATGIPVGAYDVKFDIDSTEYKIKSPEGITTVDGIKGDVKIIDAEMGKLVTKQFVISSAPVAIGNGATVINNSDISFTVASSTDGVSGGAYWNLSALSEGIKTTDIVNITYTIVMAEGYAQDDNGATVDITTGIPGVYTTSVNPIRIERTNIGRWDQLNMYDVERAVRNGSTLDDHQWLNCSGTKISNGAYKSQTISVAANFKKRNFSAKAKIEGGQWSNYSFAGFPKAESIDRNNLCISVYPGTKQANQMIIKDIMVEYAEFE